MTTCANPKCGKSTTNKLVCLHCGKPVLYVAKPKVKPPLESTVKAAIRMRLVSEGVLCWVHNVDNRLMHTGLGLGTADIIGLVPPYGRFLGIEVKRPGRKASPDQIKWLAVVRQFGGVSGVATSIEEAMVLVEEARRLP